MPRRRPSRRCSRRWRSARSPSTAVTRLPPPFMVIATQNPVDQEGTYRLPESQLDRFLLRIVARLPRAGRRDVDPRRARRHRLAAEAGAGRVVGRGDGDDRRRAAVYIADALKPYLVDLAEASRRHPAIELGLSPRATLQLAAASRAHAAAHGRRYATPDDVKAVAVSALSHRLLLRTARGARLDPPTPSARCSPTSRADRPLRREPPMPTTPTVRGSSSRSRPCCGRRRPGVRRLELYIMGAALAIVAIAAVVVVVRAPSTRRGPPLDPPAVLTAGDVGRVEVLVQQTGVAARRARVDRAGRRQPHGAYGGGPAGRDAEVGAGYRIPTERRGVLHDRPADGGAPRRARPGPIRHRGRRHRGGAVAPRAHLLDMPSLGRGVLGRHLLALAQRLGPGDFHSLRDYVDGDEPRSIHWRASARSEELKVRQTASKGCAAASSCSTSTRRQATPAPRRSSGVTAAASVVHSADRRVSRRGS